MVSLAEFGFRALVFRMLSFVSGGLRNGSNSEYPTSEQRKKGAMKECDPGTVCSSLGVCEPCGRANFTVLFELVVFQKRSGSKSPVGW